jgi:hypothetical protein
LGNSDYIKIFLSGQFILKKRICLYLNLFAILILKEQDCNTFYSLIDIFNFPLGFGSLKTVRKVLPIDLPGDPHLEKDLRLPDEKEGDRYRGDSSDLGPF